MTDKLWCIHIPGLDELYAAPSKQDAEEFAERHKKAMEEYFEELKKTKTPEQLQIYPPIESAVARVIEWPWWMQDHAEALKEWERISK